MSSIKYVPVPITERIPEKLANLGEAMDAHSVVVARQTREFLPTTGTSFSYGATNTMEIVLSDSGYLDFQTVALTMNARITAAANAQTCLENGYAPFRRAELVVNGVVVSVIDNLPQVVGQVIAATSNQDYYDNVLSRSGFWLDNKSMRNNGGDGLAATFDTKSIIIGAQQQSASGMDLWLDLSPVFRMFAESTSFFPARNVSNLTIRLYLAPAAECLFNGVNFDYAGGAVVADATAVLTLSNVRLNVDSVQLTPSFTQSFDQFIASTAGMPDGGLNILFADYTSQRSLVGSGSEVDILLSKACKYLCSIYGSLHQTTDLTSVNRVKSERQKIANLTGVQVNIGGVYYPQTRPLSRAQVLAETDKAYNRAYDTLAGCLQNQTTSVGFGSYNGSLPVAGNFDDTDAALTDVAINAAAQALPDMRYGFLNHGCFGINTEQVIMGGNSSTLNGISLTGGAPAILKMFFDSGAGGAPSAGLALSVVAVLYYKKIIKIRGDNNVEIIE